MPPKLKYTKFHGINLMEIKPHHTLKSTIPALPDEALKIKTEILHL